MMILGGDRPYKLIEDGFYKLKARVQISISNSCFSLGVLYSSKILLKAYTLNNQTLYPKKQPNNRANPENANFNT